MLMRTIAWSGLTAAGVLHAMWATGSCWPAQDKEQWARAVVGSTHTVPSPVVTWAVAGGLIVAGAVAGGALGEKTPVVYTRKAIAFALLIRALSPSTLILNVVGDVTDAEEFNVWNRKLYRPMCAILGMATLLGASKTMK